MTRQDRCDSFPHPRPTLLVATGNTHKTAEFRALLGTLARIEDLSEHPNLPIPEENGQTFEENSAIKAISAALASGSLALADDSGLEVDLLGGAPGVISARYAGPDATDADNRRKLLEEIARHSGPDCPPPTARFRCVLTLARPDGSLVGHWSGSVEGTILPAEHGQGGFGYDALFLPQGYSASFAEMPAALKNQLSHRARATAALLSYLESHPLA